MTLTRHRLEGLADGLASRGAAVATAVQVVAKAGVLRPYSPMTLARVARVLRAWGTGPAGGFASLAGPQLADVLQRERPKVVIHDQEFTSLLRGTRVGPDAPTRIVSWTESRVDAEMVDGLIARHSGSDLRPPARRGRLVILTSGTIGTPKVAPRREAGIDAAISLLSRMPIRAGYRTHVATPLFHTWDLAHLLLAVLLGTPLILRRRFDPEDALRTISSERADSFVVVPVMLQRILALPAQTRSAYGPRAACRGRLLGLRAAGRPRARLDGRVQ